MPGSKAADHTKTPWTIFFLFLSLLLSSLSYASLFLFPHLSFSSSPFSFFPFSLHQSLLVPPPSLPFFSPLPCPIFSSMFNLSTSHSLPSPLPFLGTALWIVSLGLVHGHSIISSLTFWGSNWAPPLSLED